MTPSIIQIAVVTLIAFIYGAEKNAGQILTNMSVTPAWFVGLALGDPVTGLAVGAIVQLMSLGVAAMGGASVPDYPTAAIIGAVVAITSGQEASVGVAAGIAVGMLGLQLDVIAKTANGFLGRASQRFAEEGKYSQMKSVLFLGPVFYGLTAAIPTFAVLLFGADAVNAFLSVMPSWFTTGLSIAAYMGQAGNPVGVLLWLAVAIAIFVWKLFDWRIGYKFGDKLFTTLAEKMSVFTESTSALGMMVVGALIPTVIKVSCGLTFTMGEVTLDVQTGILDQIMVGMLPVIATAIVYALVKRKVSINKIVLGILIISWVCAAFGILAA